MEIVPQGFFWTDESILELDSDDGYTLRECSKCHWIVHFKVVNFVLSEIHLN